MGRDGTFLHACFHASPSFELRARRVSTRGGGGGKDVSCRCVLIDPDVVVERLVKYNRRAGLTQSKSPKPKSTILF